MATLEEAGYVYGVHTVSDIWGAPPVNPSTAVLSQTLLAGHDTSAIPQFGEKPYRKDITQGSGRDVQKTQTYLMEKQRSNQYSLIIFVAVLAAAVFYQRSG